MLTSTLLHQPGMSSLAAWCSGIPTLLWSMVWYTLPHTSPYHSRTMANIGWCSGSVVSVTACVQRGHELEDPVWSSFPVECTISTFLPLLPRSLDAGLHLHGMLISSAMFAHTCDRQTNTKITIHNSLHLIPIKAVSSFKATNSTRHSAHIYSVSPTPCHLSYTPGT